MEYLAGNKFNLYLKLGREVAQFLKVGGFFELKTFEYLSLSKDSENFIVKLFHVFDCMYGLSPCMGEFETVEELEGECESFFKGDLGPCL
ncbi:hypothetical protein A9Q99_15720 [Gammaproteobacteria bacterium 45_16_T64]|nr:hypothetical protein A9Q99_15720 [Gammaproteobacteria bacterium 45_16_T64]